MAYNYLDELMAQMTPRKRKKLAKFKSRIFASHPDGHKTLLATIYDPCGFSEEGTRIEYHVSEEEMYHIVQEGMMPHWSRMMEEHFAQNPKAYEEWLARTAPEGT